MTIKTLVWMLSISFAEDSPLVRQHFDISQALYDYDKQAILVEVNHGCGCGKNEFKFTNVRSNPTTKTQDIDMELLSNNRCKALCHNWIQLPLKDQPELTTKFELNIHALGPQESETIHKVNFKKLKSKAISESKIQGLLRKFKNESNKPTIDVTQKGPPTCFESVNLDSSGAMERSDETYKKNVKIAEDKGCKNIKAMGDILFGDCPVSCHQSALSKSRHRELGPGDLQKGLESGFYQACKTAVEIYKVTTMNSKWSHSLEGKRACVKASSLDLKQPCFIVESSTCIKGSCKKLSKGFDLRKEEIDLTYYNYLGQPLYLLRKDPNQKLTTTIMPMEIQESEVRSRCQ